MAQVVEILFLLSCKLNTKVADVGVMQGPKSISSHAIKSFL